MFWKSEHRYSNPDEDLVIHTTYQLATLHKVGQESPRGAGHPEDFLGIVCNFWSRLADCLHIHSFIHSFIQPTHSAFLHSIVPVLIWSWSLHLCTRTCPLSPTQDITLASLPSVFCMISVSLSLLDPCHQTQTCCNFSSWQNHPLWLLYPYPATNTFPCSLLKKRPAEVPTFRISHYPFSGTRFSGLSAPLVHRRSSATTPVTTTFQVQCQSSAILCLTCHSLPQRHHSPPPPQGFFAWLGQHLTSLGFRCAVLTFVPTPPNSPASGLSLQDFPHNHSPGHITLSHGYKYHLYADNSYNYISPDLSYLPTLTSTYLFYIFTRMFNMYLQLKLSKT